MQINGYAKTNMDLDRDTRAKVKYSQFIQETADSLDKGATRDARITDFSKAFDLVPYDRLLMKIAA